MKWIGRRGSDNVDDRRGIPGGGLVVGGGLIGVIYVVISLLMGGDPGKLINQLQEQNAPQTEVVADSAQDQMAKFVSVVLADTEDVWGKIFVESGEQYVKPSLVLFTDATTSGCGNASSATGPFYCPADHKVYIDLTFMDELQNKFGAKGGDFALAYIIAHEVGHHVQTITGTSDKVREMQSRLSEAEANKLSVALELQADFYAGVWAHHDQEINNILEEGDIEEALNAAGAVGDDAIQKKIQGRVVPDAFTHGSSEQRIYWFTKGFKSGRLSDGNTFEKLGLVN